MSNYIKILLQKGNKNFEIIKRDELYTFLILPKRWIVERTFAWIDTNRRNSKNYERLNKSYNSTI